MADLFRTLSDDVVNLIFKQVCLIAPEILSDLCLVSNQFCCLATPILYKSIALSPSKQAKMIVLTSNLEANVIAHTRDIEIKGSLDWTLLADLLAKMKQLNSLRWSSWAEPIPTSVLRCLRDRWPDTQLFVESLPIGHRTDDIDLQRHVLEILDSLLGCHNIRSVKADMNYKDPKSARRLKEVFLSCPKLEVLILQVPRRDGISGWYSNGLGGYDLGVEVGEKLPPLKKLVYECPYSDLIEGLIPTSFFDFKQLRHLELRGKLMLNFLKSITGQITNLETLKIENFCLADEYDIATEILGDFMANIHGLVTLELVNPTSFLSPIFVSMITQQGEKLETLSFHRPRLSSSQYWMIYSMGQFSGTEVDTIRTSCPNLSSLTLDMEIEEDLPYEFLSAIARFQNLDTVRLYVSVRGGECAHLETDTKTIHYLASYMCRLKTGIPFKKIEVILGEFFKDLTSKRRPLCGERPDIMFSCQIGENRGIVITDNSHEISNPCWEDYLDVDRESKTQGRTWPRDIDEWNRSGKEADQILAGFEERKEDDEMESLFGSDKD